MDLVHEHFHFAADDYAFTDAAGNHEHGRLVALFVAALVPAAI
jgi:hypothetical protein